MSEERSFALCLDPRKSKVIGITVTGDVVSPTLTWLEVENPRCPTSTSSTESPKDEASKQRDKDNTYQLTEE